MGELSQRTNVGTVDDLLASATNGAGLTTSAPTTTTTARLSPCCSTPTDATPI